MLVILALWCWELLCENTHIQVGFRGTGEVDYRNCTRLYGGLPYTQARALECLNTSECLSIN